VTSKIISFMDTESFPRKMGANTKDSFRIAFEMGMAFRCCLMDRDMKDNIRTISEMEMGSRPGQMGLHTKETGKKERSMGRVVSLGAFLKRVQVLKCLVMGQNILVIGSEIICTDQ